MNYFNLIPNIFPEPPSSLSDMARQEWDLIQMRVEHLGFIRSPDGGTLAMFCSLLAVFLNNPLEFQVGKLAVLWTLAEELYLTEYLQDKAPALGKVPDGEGGYLEWHDESLMRD